MKLPPNFIIADLNHQFMESVESERESEQQMALLDGRPLPGDNFRDDPSLWDETLDLTPYINMSAFKVGAGYYQ